ncbi:MAG: motility associated factor glycosyltransferase family protein, partial [Planctomycetes bacterium]|nr:motility associated factor glycosyltransferase family protein [Planctomycetota bacterium]
LSDIHLIAEPKANWNVIDYYRTRGPISILGSELYQVALRDMPDDHDMLPAGTTVAHLAFYLAQYIGTDPIIFIGQDLAFTDNVYYSPGMAIHKTWKPELNRFCTVEMKEWERIVRNRGTLREVLDIHGKKIYTDEQMFTYIQQFEKDFAQCPAEVIDASEGGAKKQFCTTMSLKEAYDKYCKQAIDKELFAYRDEIKIERDKLKPAKEAVLRRIKDLEEFVEIGEETLTIVREMIELVDDQTELNHRMIRLDELRTRVKHRMDTHRLASFVGQGAELFRFRQDRTISADNIEGKELQRHQLQRDIGYVAEVNKGCVRMIAMLKECMNRLTESINSNFE